MNNDNDLIEIKTNIKPMDFQKFFNNSSVKLEIEKQIESMIKYEPSSSFTMLNECDMMFIEKENENMIRTHKIVSLYFSKERDVLLDKYAKDEEEILKLDWLYSSLKDKFEEINKILLNDGYDEIIVDLKKYSTNYTDGSLNKLANKHIEESEQIDNKENEVVAMLSACDTYEQEMEVLKNYGIVGKNGRLQYYNDKSNDENCSIPKDNNKDIAAK